MEHHLLLSNIEWGLAMSLIRKSTVLTLVMCFMNSVSWGNPACNSFQEEKDKANREYRSACEGKQSALAEDQKKTCDGLNDRVTKAETAYNNCVSGRADQKEFCKDIIDRINKRLEKFPYTAQKQALECMAGGISNEADLTRATLMAMSGQYSASEETCAVDGTKTTYEEQLEKKMKEVERLEKELKDVDKKIIDQQKKAIDDIKKLQDDKVDLQESWEKKKVDQETQQQEAINRHRENDIKLEESIGKGDAEMINARQELAKLSVRRNDEIFKAGVQTFQSMKRICNSQLRKYCKEDPESCKKKTSKSLNAGASRGGGKVDNLTSFMNECMDTMEKKRESIYEDTSNVQVQLINNIQERQKRLDTMKSERVRMQGQFKEIIERNQKQMVTAEQAFNQKFASLGQQIIQYQQNAQQEQMQLTQQKMTIQQNLIAAQTSKGSISSNQVKAGLDNLKGHMDDIRALAEGPDGSSDPTKGKVLDEHMQPIKGGPNPHCGKDFAAFRSQLKDFGSEDFKTNMGTANEGSK